jgi:hypothetical protein
MNDDKLEIIVEKVVWTPPPLPFPNDMLAPVRIGFADSELRDMAKAAKGKWNPEKKLWFIVFEKRLKGQNWKSI